jgi:peptide subunit release factor 1 (eRF1)
LEAIEAEVESQTVVRGIALFVSLAAPPENDPHSPAFTLFTLPRPVRTQARVERRPYIRPLLFLVDQYERVGVITADRNHARIFTLFLGEIEVSRHRTADTPKRHHAGGWKQMLLQRDVDGHVKAHIRATVREAVNIFGEHPLKRIILGGTEETLTLLEHELPARFREHLAGKFLAETHASDSEIITRALALAHEAEHREEGERVRELIDALARRPGHATGNSHHEATAVVPDTLKALSEQRVQRLLVQSGMHRAGSLCDNCATLTTDIGGTCPNCHLRLREVSDILELAVEHAQEQGAEVEFVSHNPFLEGLGGVAALLRF